MRKINRWMAVVLAVTAAAAAQSAGASSFVETFTSDPLTGPWRTFGNSSFYSWDNTNGQLLVSWDSAQNNSYFYRQLGTILAKDDDFSLEFDLRLVDIATGAKSGPFEIAVGLLNFADATRAGFWRGSGVNGSHGPRNIVEFDYFPAGYYPGWGPVDPSVSPTIISKDNGFASQFGFIELTNGADIRIALTYTASNQTLRTTITCGGLNYGNVADVVLGTNFSDFRLDTLAIACYSDAGDDYDSVIAHGVIDNIFLTMPEPPAREFAGSLVNGKWSGQFVGRSNWVYALERTTDLKTWGVVREGISAPADRIAVEDPAPPVNGAFYRIRAERP